MADATYVPALISLLGVFVGGLITAGANYILMVRKERTDEAREAANGERELKRAARLVGLELAQARDKWGFAIKLQALWDSDEITKIEAWDAHKTILAEHLSIGDWNALVEGFGAITLVERYIPTNGSYAFIADELSSMHLRIIVACDVADKHAGGKII